MSIKLNFTLSIKLNFKNERETTFKYVCTYVTFFSLLLSCAKSHHAPPANLCMQQLFHSSSRNTDRPCVCVFGEEGHVWQVGRTQKVMETTWEKRWSVCLLDCPSRLSNELQGCSLMSCVWGWLDTRTHMHTHTHWTNTKSIPWLNSQTIGPLLFIHQLNKWASFVCPHFFAIKPVCVRM